MVIILCMRRPRRAKSQILASAGAQAPLSRLPTGKARITLTIR